MFEYMMAGLPVIVSDLPEMKKIIEVFNVGVVLHENSINGMKDAIGELGKLDKYVLKENLEQVKYQYNWEEQEKKLLKVYNAL
jgi:glycosyltransferase involved in cell wall biosynthesis